MTIVLNKKREYTFPIEDATVTFNFLFFEDRDYTIYTKYFEDIKSNETDADKLKEKAEQVAVKNAQNIQHTIMRSNLVSCTGFEDEDGNPLVITDDKGVVNELYQKMVFEYVRSNQSFLLNSSGVTSLFLKPVLVPPYLVVIAASISS